MFAPPRYLRWARRFYGQVPYDLASSGMPRVSHAELGDPGPLDDLAGEARLRAAIARFNDVSEGEAIAALGTTHALWLAYATLLSPGDDVLVEDPTYEPLVGLAEGLGARVVRFARPAAERFALDPARVAAAITPRTRVIAITNLHNPGGVRAPHDALDAIARLAESRGAHLLVDEVYGPFDGRLGNDGVWPGSARKLRGNVVTVSSLTKCFGVANERVGWMLGPPDVIARAEDVILATCGLLPVPHANFGAHAFSRIGELAQRSSDLLRGKRETVAAWMSARPELTWSAPDEGLFGFATSSRAGDLTSAIEAGAAQHGVLVAAGSFFGIPNGFRLAWSIPREQLDEGLARLALVLPRGEGAGSPRS